MVEVATNTTSAWLRAIATRLGFSVVGMTPVTSAHVEATPLQSMRQTLLVKAAAPKFCAHDCAPTVPLVVTA